MDGIPLYHAGNLPATAAPSATPTAEPTAAPTPAVGDTLVYVSERSAYYHRGSSCPSAAGLTLLPTHLDDAVASGKQRCPSCNPPQS